MINVARMNNNNSDQNSNDDEGNGPNEISDCLPFLNNQQQQIKIDHEKCSETSSNYEASIFEDEDEDTISDDNDEFEKLSRRSMGPDVQDHGSQKQGKQKDPWQRTLSDCQSFAVIEKKLEEQQKNGEEDDLVPDLIRKPPVEEVKYEPMPLIRSGASMEADLKMGWRPNEGELHGAPIPLYYDFESFTVPKDPLSQKPFLVQYRGPRIQTSYDVHKKFANLENLTIDQCPDPRANHLNKNTKSARSSDITPEPYPSYSFKFPLRMPLLEKHEFDEPPPFVGMNPQLTPEKLDSELVFDSAFESGNLDMVIKTQPMHYDLYMRVDTNTRGHHQWFYYSCEVPQSMANKTVTFRVVNFTKPMSLYTSGMRVCYARQTQGYQWQKGGKNISYGRSHVVRRPSYDPARVIYYSTLKFDFEFTKGEKVFFAYCFPYTFTMLSNFIRNVGLVHNQDSSDIYKEGVLCKSLSGVDVPIITITSRIKSDPKFYNQIKLSEFEDDDSKLSLPMYKKKKYAIINARVHPGESNSSYMMQGLIKYLLGDSHQAKQLRKRVIFKIVPMINTDGVIVGNYRTSMSGNDLNRRYNKPDFRLHPAVCAIKQLASDLIFGPSEENKKKANDEPDTLNEEILAFIDMHGHSRKKNVFIYGPQEPLHSSSYLKMRIIPKLIAEETQKFRYHSCRFRLEQAKLKAARIVMWREFNIMNCFTFEASFHAHFDHDNKNTEFTCAQFEEMGEHLANSLFEYLMIIEEEQRRRKLKEMAKKKKKKLKLQQIHQNVTNTNFSQANRGIGSASSAKEMVNNLGNHQNLQSMVGKIGKKAAAGVRSPSSRARNVSHITHKDSDKELPRNLLSNTKGKEANKGKKNESRVREKTTGKKKGKSETPVVASRNQNSPDANTRRVDNSQVAQPQNPNEPDDIKQELQVSNIQIGSHDLQEIQRFANAQLTTSNEEEQSATEPLVLEQVKQKKPKLGFRNLKDMFAEVREQEKEKAEVQEGDTDASQNQESETSVVELDVDKVEGGEKGCGQGGDEEDNDELSKEQQRKLHGDIFNVISRFVKVNNLKEHEYFGVSEQTLKKQKQKKLRQAQIAAAKEAALKEAKPEGSATKEKPEKTKKKKRHSYLKETMQAGHNQGVNYTKNTLSVAQKRRSFNTNEMGGIPQKHDQEYQLSQLQMQQRLAGTRLRAGLSSPVYYNLYPSSSTFQNYYVYHFDDHNGKASGIQPNSGVHYNKASLTSQLSLDGNQIQYDASPSRVTTQYGPNQQQQQKSLGNVYQSKETGKVYHLSRRTDDKGNNVMVSTAYGGSLDKRRSDPRDAHEMIESLALNQTGARKHSQNQQPSSVFAQGNSGCNTGNGGSSARNEFISQLNQLRQSHVQQAVQPMIFYFFNSKADPTKRQNNRNPLNQRQNEPNNPMAGNTSQQAVITGVIGQARSSDNTAVTSSTGTSRHGKLVKAHEPRKPPAFLLSNETNFYAAVKGSNQPYQQNGSISSTKAQQLSSNHDHYTAKSHGNSFVAIGQIKGEVGQQSRSNCKNRRPQKGASSGADNNKDSALDTSTPQKSSFDRRDVAKSSKARVRDSRGGVGKKYTKAKYKDFVAQDDVDKSNHSNTIVMPDLKNKSQRIKIVDQEGNEDIKRNSVRKIHLLNNFNSSVASATNNNNFNITLQQKAAAKASRPIEEEPLHRLHLHESTKDMPYQLMPGSVSAKKNLLTEEVSGIGFHAREQIESNTPAMSYMLNMVPIAHQKYHSNEQQQQQSQPSFLSLPKDNGSGIKLLPPAISYQKSSVPIQSLQSRIAEPRHQLSQLTECNDVVGEMGGAATSRVEGAYSSVGHYRKDSSGHQNSLLQQSGDYQTRTMKHLPIDGTSKTSFDHRGSLCSTGNPMLNISQDRIVVKNENSKIQLRKAQKLHTFGQRAPPELYQKNPYQTTGGVNQQIISSQSDQVESSQGSPDRLAHQSASMAAIEVHNITNLMHDSITSPPSNQHLVNHPAITAGMGIWPSQIQNLQNTALISNGFINNYQRQMNQPLLAKSKTTVGRHQGYLPPPHYNQQQAASNQMKQSLLAGMSKILTQTDNDQRVCMEDNNQISPLRPSGRDQEPVMVGHEESKMSMREPVASLWSKTNGTVEVGRQISQDRVSDQNVSNINEYVTITSSNPNSLIFQQKALKYAGRQVQQRDTIITGEVIESAEVGQTDRNSPKYTQSFSSPQEKAQMKHMALMAGQVMVPASPVQQRPQKLQIQKQFSISSKQPQLQVLSSPKAIKNRNKNGSASGSRRISGAISRIGGHSLSVTSPKAYMRVQDQICESATAAVIMPRINDAPVVEQITTKAGGIITSHSTTPNKASGVSRTPARKASKIEPLQRSND